MTAAVAADMLTVSPCRGVPLPRVEHEEMRYLNPVEIACLTDVIRPQYRTLVFVGAYGGLRIGELAGLRRSRVDLDAGTVDVAENITEVQGKLQSGPPKTKASRRRVSLPSGVVEELAVHLRAPGRPTDYVFRAPASGPLRINGFRHRVWLPAVMAAGLPGLRIHDLRHTALALWIAAGASQRRSPPEPATRRSASCWTATATCSPSRMRRSATASTCCSVARRNSDGTRPARMRTGHPKLASL
jgi:integrase